MAFDGKLLNRPSDGRRAADLDRARMLMYHGVYAPAPAPRASRRTATASPRRPSLALQGRPALDRDRDAGRARTASTPFTETLAAAAGHLPGRLSGRAPADRRPRRGARRAAAGRWTLEVTAIDDLGQRVLDDARASSSTTRSASSGCRRSRRSAGGPRDPDHVPACTTRARRRDRGRDAGRRRSRTGSRSAAARDGRRPAATWDGLAEERQRRLRRHATSSGSSPRTSSARRGARRVRSAAQAVHEAGRPAAASLRAMPVAGDPQRHHRRWVTDASSATTASTPSSC